MVLAQNNENVRTNYGPNWKEEINGNNMITMWTTGVVHVEEDRIWKNIKDARSLYGTNGAKVTINMDDNFPVRILDYNYSHITTCFKSTPGNVFQSLPINVTRQDRGKAISGSRRNISFVLPNQEKCFTMPLTYDETIRYGHASTSITRSAFDATNGTDTRQKFVGTTDRGAETIINSGSAIDQNERVRSFINFTVPIEKAIPDTDTINWMKIEFKEVSGGTPEEEPEDVQIYPINKTWVESTTTAYQDIGNFTGFNGSRNLNIGDVEPAEPLALGFFNITIDNTFATQLARGELGEWDEGIILISIEVGADNGNWQVASSDDTTAKNRWKIFFNTTTEVIPPDLCDCPSSGDWSIPAGNACSITEDCNVNGNDIILAKDSNMTVSALIYNFNNFYVYGTLTCTIPLCFG